MRHVLERPMIPIRMLASMVLAGAVAWPVAAQQAAKNPAPGSAAAQRVILEQYCIGCHSGPTPFAGLNLANLDPANLEENGAIWEKMIRKLRDRQMPPAGMPRPDPVAIQGDAAYTGDSRINRGWAMA